MYKHTYTRGMSFVELIIAAAILTLVFGGLLGFFQTAVKLIDNSKARAGAVALANERLEYIRSLPYNDVGTISGIPPGNIPQNATTTLNGTEYSERILIEYVDAPEDGTGGDDENGIVNDYKRIKVEYRWSDRGEDKMLSLISNVVPPGIETSVGGGTLTVNVFNALATPVIGAEVRVVNTAESVDVTRYTNASGIAQFSGAPAASGYEITVTGSDMSTDQTYSVTVENPSPTTPHVAVLESQVSTMNFQIDYLSDLTIETVGAPTVETVTETFDDASGVSSMSDVVVGGGEVVLGPPYDFDGSVRGTEVAPVTFSAWDTATFNADVSADTAIAVQVYSVASGVYSLIPDTDLPGNSTGFATGTIVLSTLDTTTYTSLALGAELTTTDASSTPTLYDWEIGYVVSEPPIGNVDFTLTGTKSIGLNGTSTVYKYQQSHSTNGSGVITLPDLEWDLYDVALDTASYIVREACAPIPYALNPGVDETLKLTLVPPPTHSLHVYVVDGDGAVIPGATATLSRTGFSESEISSACGQVFFGTGLSSAADYILEVSAPGYVTSSQTEINIAGNNTLVVTLSGT